MRDVDFYDMKDISLYLALDIDNSIRNGDDNYVKRAEELSKMFFELSIKNPRDLTPTEHISLVRFYFGDRERVSYFIPQDNLKDKKLEDLNLQSWLFARDLSTISEMSKERKAEMRDECLFLYKNLARDFRNIIFKFAA